MSGRVVRFGFGPSDTLGALLRLRAAASTPAWAFTEALRDAVRAEFDAAAETLARLGGGIEWLEDRGLAAVARPKAPKGRAVKGQGAKGRGAKGARASEVPAYALPVQVCVDLRVLERGVREEGRNTEGPWHACASALRTLCDALRAGVYVSPQGPARVGREVVSVAALRAVWPTPRARKAPAAAARVERETKSAGPPPAAGEKARGKKARGRVEGAGAGAGAGVGGFGGLPDDAESVEADAPAVGPRGISVDAEHFLEAAGLAQWPCTREELERGRKRALARLHPDHAGEGSAPAFHRAVRGHAELVRALEKLAAAVTVTTAVPAREEPPVAPAVPSAARAERKRAQTARASSSRTPVESREAPPAAKPVRQWPPTPVAL